MMNKLSRLGSAKDDSVALATVGVIADNKAASMASLGLFGAANPTPPTPVHIINGQAMMVTVGRMM